nr:FtsQ-type POTRA domain-containing protein [Bacillus dakarensis]
MDNEKVVSLEDRIPKLKQQRRKKANKRLIFLLLLFFVLIACVVYFQSPLSHVNKIEVEGNRVYTDEEIISKSSVSKNSSIWNVDEKGIKSKISELTEIKSVDVRTKMPNAVVISVEEWRRIAYLLNEGDFLPILENGDILEKETGKTPVSAPILFSFPEGDVTEEMIRGLETIPEEVLNSISEIHYSPKETDKTHITLFMNDGFEVSASIRTFAENMIHYPSIVSQLDPAIKGIIDLEVPYFSPYELKGAEEESEKEEG